MHFFERIYSDLVEFCDGNTDNQTQVLEGIRYVYTTIDMLLIENLVTTTTSFQAIT